MLELGAKMMQSSKRGVFLNPLSMLLAGLILGVAARLFDIYFQILGEIFSQMAIWILFGTLIAVYSPRRRRPWGIFSHSVWGGLLCNGRDHPWGLWPVVHYRLDGVCTGLPCPGIFCVDDKEARRFPENHCRRDRGRVGHEQHPAL